jgi:miniconductance mechanosensitive channel
LRINLNVNSPDMLENLEKWLISQGINELYADTVKLFIVFAIIALLAVLAYFITKRVILFIVYRISKKTKTIFDDILVEKKVFHRLAHFIPAFIIYQSVVLPLAEYPKMLALVQKASQIYMFIVGLAVLLAFINALNVIYLTLPISKSHSIKGYLQVIKFILYILVGIFIISVINGSSPAALLAGLGAMAAVLMFIFKDPILGLVASIQLSVNDMLRPGDWIEMPSRKADGIVQDISLTTVKVQNWDKTLTTIPTYALVSDSFTNWRGMQESEGRRLKKSIFIDMKSVRFYSDKIIDKLEKNPFIAKNFDVKKYVNENQTNDGNNDSAHRVITNLGMFRAYLEAYLLNIPVIHPEMTLLVHYLQPTENGLPLEIIAFSKQKDGALFEKLQCDIFDHILAILPEFELRIFQRQSGEGDAIQ